LIIAVMQASGKYSRQAAMLAAARAVTALLGSLD
jgi:hypothetical protein